jgi:hypothetical protein
MFDDFLSSTLKIILILDIIGVIAYFGLGAFKTHKQKQPTLVPISVSNTVSKPSWWRRTPRRITAESSATLQEACVSLKRVLYSFEKGLA